MPIGVHIDTLNNNYCIQQRGIGKATLIRDKKEILKIKLNILFFKLNFYPLRHRKENSKSHIGKKKKKGINKSLSLKTGLRLLKTFKIKKLWMDIDTGDCIANAKLFPIFAFLNFRVGGFNINFEDRNQLVLHIESRPIDIIKLYFNLKK
jgi:hypothetical protein